MKLLILAVSLLIGGCYKLDPKVGEIYYHVIEKENPFQQNDTTFYKITAVKNGWMKFDMSNGDTLRFYTPRILWSEGVRISEFNNFLVRYK